MLRDEVLGPPTTEPDAVQGGFAQAFGDAALEPAFSFSFTGTPRSRQARQRDAVLGQVREKALASDSLTLLSTYGTSYSSISCMTGKHFATLTTSDYLSIHRVATCWRSRSRQDIDILKMLITNMLEI